MRTLFKNIAVLAVVVLTLGLGAIPSQAQISSNQIKLNWYEMRAQASRFVAKYGYGVQISPEQIPEGVPTVISVQARADIPEGERNVSTLPLPNEKLRNSKLKCGDNSNGKRAALHPWEKPVVPAGPFQYSQEFSGIPTDVFGTPANELFAQKADAYLLTVAYKYPNGQIQVCYPAWADLTRQPFCSNKSRGRVPHVSVWYMWGWTKVETRQKFVRTDTKREKWVKKVRIPVASKEIIEVERRTRDREIVRDTPRVTAFPDLRADSKSGSQATSSAWASSSANANAFVNIRNDLRQWQKVVIKPGDTPGTPGGPKDGGPPGLPNSPDGPNGGTFPNNPQIPSTDTSAGNQFPSAPSPQPTGTNPGGGGRVDVTPTW
jgi:hypothetical protein